MKEYFTGLNYIRYIDANGENNAMSRLKVTG